MAFRTRGPRTRGGGGPPRAATATKKRPPPPHASPSRGRSASCTAASSTVGRSRPPNDWSEKCSRRHDNNIVINNLPTTSTFSTRCTAGGPLSRTRHPRELVHNDVDRGQIAEPITALVICDVENCGDLHH